MLDEKWVATKKLLQLMQLSDSAVPIGAAAHSFGLEGLAEVGGVSPESLREFAEAYLEEQGVLEACFCRASYQCGLRDESVAELCFTLSALKPARESREGSLVLGRRLLGLISALVHEKQAVLLETAFLESEPHHAIVFGYIGAVLAIEEEMVVGAFLHQTVTTIVSSAQRLMPVGQRQAAATLWSVKDRIAECGERSRETDLAEVGSFLPALEIASMRHPSLETRLFLS